VSPVQQQSTPAGGNPGAKPRFVPLSREGHAGKKWQLRRGYSFAAGTVVAPIVLVEIARAAVAMPLAFVQEPGGRFILVAMLSFPPSRNMLVAPDGRWLGAYVPACFRSYPFALVPQQGTDQVTLCIDADCGLVVEGGSTGEDFFDQNGNISPSLKKFVDLLTGHERSRKATEVAMAALAKAGVIQPWPLTFKAGQEDKPVTGLHHIDEVALNKLTDDSFLGLRKAPGALPIAYAQMFSAGQLGLFQHLAKVQAQLAPPPAGTLPENLDSLFELPADDLIQFR
jgi:hypothetical protein